MMVFTRDGICDEGDSSRAVIPIPTTDVFAYYLRTTRRFHLLNFYLFARTRDGDVDSPFCHTYRPTRDGDDSA